MRRPRVKRVHFPVRLRADLIAIGGWQYGVGAELADDEQGTLWRLLQLLDGVRTRDEVVSALVRERPDVDGDSLYEAIDALAAAGYLEEADSVPPPGFEASEMARYDRSVNYFAWIDMAGRESRFELQARLKSARVTVCGVGGTGSAVAASLVASGVGALHCVDFDDVEETNLTRQLLFTEDDIGADKVATVVGRLSAANRHVRVTGERLLIESQTDLERLMRDCDLFVLCADEPRGAIIPWTNAASLATGTPWQLAQYAGPTLVTGIFVPGVTDCYACIPTMADSYAAKYGAEPEDELFAWEGHAVLAPTANLTGQMAALEAVYHLTGLPLTSLGRVYHLCLTDFSHFWFAEPDARRDCGVCGRRSEATAATTAATATAATAAATTARETVPVP